MMYGRAMQGLSNSGCLFVPLFWLTSSYELTFLELVILMTCRLIIFHFIGSIDTHTNRGYSYVSGHPMDVHN